MSASGISLKRWDWECVQHEDISISGPRVRWDLCDGLGEEKAFSLGRKSFKQHSRHCPYSDIELCGAFWEGWKWQEKRDGKWPTTKKLKPKKPATTYFDNFTPNPPQMVFAVVEKGKEWVLNNFRNYYLKPL